MCLLPVWLLVLHCIYTAAGVCDLAPWLQEEAGTDKGYHVLCAPGNGHLEVHVDGLASSLPSARMLTLPLDESIAGRLDEELKLRNALSFKPTQSPDGQGPWRGPEKVRWFKQSWAVFTDLGARWEPEELSAHLASYQGVLLLFEGGTWRWPGVRLGYERHLLPGVRLRTVALKPALFEFVFEGSDEKAGAERGLGPELLKDVVSDAEPKLERSLTEGQATHIRTSEQSWFSYTSTPDLKRLKELTVEAIRVPSSYFEQNLQVLRYRIGQLYDAHRDYWDPREFPDEQRFVHHRSRTWNMRHATVLWFLQAPEKGGDTWFPRAHGGPIPWGEWTACDERGVKMGGRNGTMAILFYSLYSSGDIDTYSWHCGCPVEEGVKWAANSWVWNQPQSEPPFAKRRKKQPSPAGKEEF
eukprot:TRINITY_DN10998_c0_g2_i1.p1 TRINITY_DN10998_c0_g2~~TRINITY_DN10998_c0_g2_i1.p1  ORF type:complete len:412 (-),score=60.18 TRINITY_DN10998_c0_g2_i1:190-1425(-)